MWTSFLKQTLCLRFLSICLPNGGTFSHHLRLWKFHFLQLFRSFSLLVRSGWNSNFFAKNRASFAPRSTHSIPRCFSVIAPGQAASFAPDIPIQFLYRHPIVFALSGGSYDWNIFTKEIVHFRHKSMSFRNKNSACPARKRSIPGWTFGDGLGTLFIEAFPLPGENPGNGLSRNQGYFPLEILSGIRFPKQFPHIFPSIRSFGGILRRRHTHSFSRTALVFSPFRRQLRLRHFRVKSHV